MNTQPEQPQARRRAIEVEESMQLVQVVQVLLTNAMAKHGFALPEKGSYQAACEVLNGMRQYAHRGSLPIPDLFKIQRNAAIRAKFNGRNLKEVCDEFDVARTTVYRICGKRGVGTAS